MARASGPMPEPANPSAPAIRFGSFELRPAERLLLRDGEPVVLRARAFDLLAALAARAGRLVGKDELLELVWPGLVVEENNIAAQVATLRKAVGGDVVATVPGHGYRFVAEVLDAPAATPAPPRPHPSARVLFGRDDDRRRLHAALRAGGCVTLVGAGGVGKTALARAVAEERTAGRTTWVDLAALDASSDLAGALCRALGVPTAASAPAGSDDVGPALVAALAALSDGHPLLVLDNAEHVVDGVAALAATLVAKLPALALLVTSQLPLGIAVERVQPLEPLPSSAGDRLDDGAPDPAAVQLLRERIRAADPRFPLDAAALPQLHELASRLDGLPLALEMAAAVVPLLGLAGVLGALDRRLDVLRRGRRDAPERHRTLRAALEWSHGLLGAAEQRMLRRVGVFASDFPLELAVAVAAEADGDRWDDVDAFAALVERSLVASLHADPPRYRLTETVRAFALERLGDADDEAHCVRSAAARAIGTRLRDAAPDAHGETTADLANVPELLAWALTHDPEAAIELAVGAAQAATWTAWRGDAAQWVAACEPLLASRSQEGHGSHGSHGIARATEAAWWREFARQQTFVRGARAVEAAGRAAAIERERGDDAGLFWSLVPLLRSRTVDAAGFDACRAEAEALLARHPEWPARARIVFAGTLALEHRRRGEFEAALGHQRAEAAEARRAGLHQAARNAESNVAATLVGLMRYEEALASLDARASDSADLADGDAVGAHDLLQRLSALIGLGRLDAASALVPEAVRWCRRFDVVDLAQVLALLAALRGRLGPAALLLGHHRAELARRGAAPPEDGHAAWREAERLVADGLDATAARALTERGATLDATEADRAMLDAAA